MSGGSMPTTGERLKEFFRRLLAAPAAASFDEAYQQLCDTPDAVEDELTHIPNNPATWMTDGRMYPPQADRIRVVKGRPELRRLVSRGHTTFVSDGGAIKVVGDDGTVHLDKPGADGKGV